MPDGTSRAERFIVRVVNARSGFFYVRAGIGPAPTFKKRGEDKHKLRKENQNQSRFP